MKIHIITILLILSCSVFGQLTSQSSERVKSLEEIRKLNERFVQLYSQKKYDEALAVGKNIQDIAIKENLTSDARVLTAISNVAEAYLAKGKETEALAVLKTALSGYESIGVEGRTGLEKTLLRMANLFMEKKDFKNAEAHYAKLKSLTETAYGEKSRQAAHAYLMLANLYNYQEKKEDAESYYVKAILVNDAVLTKAERAKREDVETYKCFVYHREYQRNKMKDISRILDDFYKKRDIPKEYGESLDIINGKALVLGKPVYPEKLKPLRLRGFVIVEVEIDEEGYVTNAKTTCGIREFMKIVENAAMNSRFSSTFKNGLPIKTKGDIVYYFIPQ